MKRKEKLGMELKKEEGGTFFYFMYVSENKVPQD